jgi:hypothetical protein
MHTSIVLVALVSVAGVPDPAARGPLWHRDYFGARKFVQRDHKPLAVFIGRGEAGWDDRSKEGELSKEAKILLESSYICVYVDTTTAEGRQLANSFDLKAGLVISDGSGEEQAFRHEGNLANRDLERHLRRFRDPDRIPTKTETHAGEEVHFYAPPQSSFAPGFGSVGRSC